MPAAHRITDLARPRLPWPVATFNRLAGPLVERRTSLDPESLLGTAARQARLDDFGDASFREPLGVLLAALEREAHLSALGRIMARAFVLQLLTTRLRVQDLITRHPEILAEEVRAPIFIVGLPRTGTTHLHNLLARHPGLRSLPYWESLEPVPAGGHPPAPGAVDPRVRRCALALRFQQYVMPHFRLMHEMDPDARHEEIQLLAAAFSTMLFESMFLVPSYRDWYRATDQTAAYHYLRRLLQVLQWLRGPRRWVLKSPQHLEQVRPLLAVFPDARNVQTHREPVRITASVCTMIAYALRMQSERIDPAAVGRYWAARTEDLLRAAVEQRPLIPADQVMDVRFDEFMADDMAAAERAFAFADQSVDAAAREAIARYVASHPRGRFGTIDYRLDDFDLDAAERRRALRFYQDRFGVVEER